MNKALKVMGRPRVGVGRPVKITLPEADWDRIDETIQNGHAENYADYFRQLHQAQFSPMPERLKR